MFNLLAEAYRQSASMAGVKVFFGILEVVVICAGIYLIKKRKTFFGYKGQEGDTYASSNLRMIMVVLVWIHVVLLLGLMTFGVH